MPLEPGNTVTIQLDGDGTQSRRRSRVLPVAGSASTNLTNRFEDATRQLLRSRLMVATLVWLCVVTVVTSVDLVLGNTSFAQVVVMLLTAATLALACIYMWRHEAIAMRWLRWMELGIGAVAVCEVMFVLVSLTEPLAAASQLESLATLRAYVALVTCLFIAVYGIFIPSNWRRTAIVTAATALTPVAVILLHWCFSSSLQSLGPIAYQGIAAVPMFTLLMAAIATAGAHIVHRTRRQVEEARQYGQYRLAEEIGRGGMGVVYKATHRMLKRPAAIKLIRSESAADPSAVEGFEREVQLSATLSHFNTVQVYDYGRTEDGDFFYVMEFLEGATLADSVRLEGALSSQVAIPIVLQICSGLAEAHAIGMVHRDLKPGNIFLCESNAGERVVKIIDFGLATKVDDEANSDGKISGTPHYMSPEQAKGAEVDFRSDIYALGCMLFEIFTGSTLFHGDSVMEILTKQIQEVPNLTRLDSTGPNGTQIREIVAKCVSKDVAQRYENVRALRKDLLNVLNISEATAGSERSR